MANRQNRKGRSKSDEQFLALPHYMLKSAAWRSLTPASRAVYLEIATLYNGRNNGSLALSVRDAAARCRINKDTACRTFRELTDKGFIERVVAGAFQWKVSPASEYRLTVKRCDKNNAPPSKAFMSWRPPPARAP